MIEQEYSVQNKTACLSTQTQVKQIIIEKKNVKNKRPRLTSFWFVVSFSPQIQQTFSIVRLDHARVAHVSQGRKLSTERHVLSTFRWLHISKRAFCKQVCLSYKGTSWAENENCTEQKRCEVKHIENKLFTVVLKIELKALDPVFVCALKDSLGFRENEFWKWSLFTLLRVSVCITNDEQNGLYITTTRGNKLTNQNSNGEQRMLTFFPKEPQWKLDITKGHETDKMCPRYTEVLFHLFYHYRGEEHRSLYRELRYIEVRLINVPL